MALAVALERFWVPSKLRARNNRRRIGGRLAFGLGNREPADIHRQGHQTHQRHERHRQQWHRDSATLFQLFLIHGYLPSLS